LIALRSKEGRDTPAVSERLVKLKADLERTFHYYWRVKLDGSRPIAYGVVLAFLLASRLLGKFSIFSPRLRNARITP